MTNNIIKQCNFIFDEAITELEQKEFNNVEYELQQLKLKYAYYTQDGTEDNTSKQIKDLIRELENEIEEYKNYKEV